MNTRYCTCGKANLYEIAKPRFCCGCGKDFDAVFGSAAAPVAAPAQVARYQEPAPKAIHPASRHRLQTQATRDPDEDDDTEPDDPIEMHNDGELAHVSARQLAAALKSQGLSFTPAVNNEDGNGNCFKLGSFQNVRDAISQTQAAATKKPRRRKGST